MRKNSGHLPFFGIGPLYVGLVCGLTAAGVWASDSGLLESGIVPGLKVPMRVAGVLVADGLYDAPHRGEMAAPPLRSRVRRLLPPR